jgi:hypothetical protein
VNARIPVVAALPEYAVAVAGLPRRAERVDRAAGAIVVIDGATAWWDAAAIAVEGGAAAVLVAEPLEVPLELVAGLADRAEVPIVVHRARLREDLVTVAIEQRAGVSPRVVVAECRAPASELPAMVRDAIGWMRALTDERLVVASASIGSGTGAALLRAAVDGRVVGSLIVAATDPDATVLRLQALGETATEVEIDDLLGRSELATSSGTGRLVAPARLEAGERAAVRRAVDLVVVQGRSSTELEQLLHDAAAASTVLGGSVDSTIFS